MAVIEQYNDSNVSVIVLNNSEKGNILNPQGLELLFQILNQSLQDKSTRLIILKSNGSNFCLGMDFVSLLAINNKMDEVEQAIDNYIKLLETIYISPKPVLCLVNGAVKAGGVGLMAACDIIIASENSSFELSEILFGLIPANVLPYLFPLRISPQKIRYLVMTSKKLLANEAKQINLIDEVFSIDQLEKETKAIIKNILRASPKALSEIKQFTTEINQEMIDVIRIKARAKLLELIKDPENIKAIQAFQQGNTPGWFEKYKPSKSLV